MPSADFCNFFPSPLDDGSLMAKLQTSPGNALSPSRLCPSHLRTSFPYRYWTLKIFAFSSSLHASYAISVRQTSALPAASSRFHLAMDTLAVRLTIPPVGFVGDFHSLVSAPCRAHETENALRKFCVWSAFSFNRNGSVLITRHRPRGSAQHEVLGGSRERNAN